MASDIRISELNEINVNSNVNEIIINSRESSNDIGVSKKIQVSNLLTDSIVKTNNLDNLSVTTDKLAGQAITANKIANKTITNSQIADRTVTNSVLDDNSVNPRVLDEDGNYNVEGLVATSSISTPAATVTGTAPSNRLTVTSGNLNLNSINYTFPNTETPRTFLRTDGAGRLTWEEAVPGDGTSLVFSEVSPVGTVVPWAGGGSSVPDDKWINLGAQRRFLGSSYPELRDILGTKWGPRTNQAGDETPTGAYYALPDIRARAIVGNGTGDDGTNKTSTDPQNLLPSVCNTAFGTYGGQYCHLLIRQEINHLHFTGTFSSPNNDDYYPFLINKPGTNQFNPGARSITNTAYCGRWIAGEGNNTNPNTMPAGPNVNKPYNAMTATQLLNDDQHMNNVAHENVQPYVAMSYIIKAKPDDIEQYDMSVGRGLSALDAVGIQTSSVNLSSTEIGLKVTDDFQFDGSGRLQLKPSVTAARVPLYVKLTGAGGPPLTQTGNGTYTYTKALLEGTDINPDLISGIWVECVGSSRFNGQYTQVNYTFPDGTSQRIFRTDAAGTPEDHVTREFQTLFVPVGADQTDLVFQLSSNTSSSKQFTLVGVQQVVSPA